MKKTLLLGSSLFAVSIMGLGCNPVASVQQKVADSVAERAIQAGTGGTVHVTAEGSANLPDNFPSDVPRYPGAMYISTIVQDKIAITNFTTSDKAQKVSDWFDAQLKTAGFTNDLSEVMNGTVKLYHKGNVSIAVTVLSQDDNSPSNVSLQRSLSDDSQP